MDHGQMILQGDPNGEHLFARITHEGVHIVSHELAGTIVTSYLRDRFFCIISKEAWLAVAKVYENQTKSSLREVSIEDIELVLNVVASHLEVSIEDIKTSNRRKVTIVKARAVTVSLLVSYLHCTEKQIADILNMDRSRINRIKKQSFSEEFLEPIMNALKEKQKEHIALVKSTGNS